MLLFSSGSFPPNCMFVYAYSLVHTGWDEGCENLRVVASRKLERLI